MSINLSTYNNIETALLVRIDVQNYRTNPGTASSQVLKFSDYYVDITYTGADSTADTYTGLGKLVNVSASTNELRSSGDSITVTLSGIPTSSIQEIIYSDIKDCDIKIYRAIVDKTSGEILPISGNPTGRFFGRINNYSLEEEYDAVSRTSTNTISLICSSYIELMQNKLSGRRTNPLDHKRLYPTDISMDRVPNLSGANINFGA
jgi:hypothetical protein